MLAAHDGAGLLGLFGVAVFVEVFGDKLGVFEDVLDREVGVVLRIDQFDGRRVFCGEGPDRC